MSDLFLRETIICLNKLSSNLKTGKSWLKIILNILLHSHWEISKNFTESP